MDVLPLHHDDQTYSYAQLERAGVWALFCQQHKVSGVQRFEVVRIRIRAAHTWPNGTHTPEHEAYPSSASWGRDGYTHHALPEAQAHFHQLLSQEGHEDGGD